MKVSRQIKIIHANKNERKPGNNTYIRIKQTLKQRLTKYKEGNYIIRNGAILEGNIPFLNTHIPYTIPHKNIKHILRGIKREIDINNTRGL